MSIICAKYIFTSEITSKTNSTSLIMVMSLMVQTTLNNELFLETKNSDKRALQKHISEVFTQVPYNTSDMMTIGPDVYLFFLMRTFLFFFSPQVRDKVVENTLTVSHLLYALEAFFLTIFGCKVTE